MNLQIKKIDSNNKDILAFRNNVFPEMKSIEWMGLGNCGSYVEDANQIIGILPMQVRDFKISENNTIEVMNENNVCVDPLFRGKSLGSMLLNGAIELYKSRYFAFNVFRFDEKSKAYGFYRKNEHSDLYFCDLYSSKSTYNPSKNIKFIEKESFLLLEDRIIELFNRCYKDLGGYSPRIKGYYKRVLNNHVYKNSMWDYLVYDNNGAIEGFIIINNKCGLSPNSVIYDIGFTSEHVFKDLIKGALSKGSKVDFFINNEFQCFDLLLELGFKYQYETPFLLSKIINFREFALRYINPDYFKNGLILKIPGGDFEIVKGEFPSVYSMKTSLLTRLLFRRASFKCMYDQGLIRSSVNDRKEIEYLSRLFTFHKWYIPAIDFI